ncbi:MAG: ABC transporter ATP-binding protein [Bacilli bacterium]|nr:ABC transporter ATP-binding protein [Bacilli bacterium]
MNKRVMVLKDVSKVYDKKNERIIALDKASYSFESGKFYAIMGHSGSGKSTLINILGLIHNYTEGEYVLDSLDVSKMSSDELADKRMQYIGFVFQNFYLDEYLKAYENVMLPMLINKEISKENREDKAKDLLKKLGLSERINHYPKEMSGGEQQRVAIARALANDPQIILADEPTGNLDEESEQFVFKILKDLSAEGKCVIVVSHSNAVLDYADVVLKISKGKLEESKDGQ